MKSIVVLISGRGSNLGAIADACEAEQWPARIRAVISNRPGAAGLDMARERGIEAVCVDHTGFASREAFDDALASAIDRHAPDVIALAGFMRVLGGAFVRRYEGRMLNIHPSLLPSFTGLNTHQRALDAGCKVHGATVHFVTPELDHGPIIAQASVPVLPDDSARTLAERVLEREHVLYPRALRWFVEGRLTVDGARVTHRDGAPQWLL